MYSNIVRNREYFHYATTPCVPSDKHTAKLYRNMARIRESPPPHQPINVGKKQQPPKTVPLGSLPVNKTWVVVTQLLLTTQGRAFVCCANYMIPQKIKSADNRVISGVWQGIVLWAGSHLLSGQERRQNKECHMLASF